MRQALDRFLHARSQTELISASCLLVAVIGLIDYLTGIELSFSIFYLIPVALASWYLGKRPGFSICLVSAIAWYVVDDIGRHVYSSAAIPVWNAAVRLGFFVITTYLLVQLRTALDTQTTFAQHDGLTGLLNSRSFEANCKLLFDLAARHHHPLSLGYLDLDGFKAVNDSLGHTMGDEVLKAVATALGERLRTSDLVCRLGGDEFAILLPETDVGGATEVFSEIRRRLVELAAQNRWPIGFSIGVAVLHSPFPKPGDAVRLADELMYRAKAGKKNSPLIQQYPPGASSDTGLAPSGP